MYETVVESGTGLVSTYGLGILLVAFALEGALIGKVIPTRALFVSAVLVLGTDTFGLVSVFMAALVGATAGQLFIFTVIRRTPLTASDLPGKTEPAHSGRLQEWFDRWELPAVALSNVLPVVRGTLTIPAAMGEKSALRFSSAAVLGTAVYAVVLIGLAVGLEFLVSLL